ncbi:type IV secretory system conjugative DNA transfer family protein [Celeribacter litoreus]|uniref:type IV secretory system conjugative DNA transfer family protein n=1 Tax=Celeribacter litoreus TaxID=2876714 RepID=UPI001CCBA405|nr:type IV secretory system conjugative DNA transfer family protein [Celeribacter litoreus]MCA0044654.1 type IV secretory system conjugative DNA transfer family protein [Celeribacter litoreus]
MPASIPLGYHVQPTNQKIGFCPAGRNTPITERLIRDDSDAGLVTIAGTGTGKGVSQVIPTALTYPGSMYVIDVKGEIAEVTARRRREMGQKVIILDPFGGARDALNPMELIDPRTEDAFDQCKRLARMMRPKTSDERDPFWDDSAEHIVAGTLLFLATHIHQEDRGLSLLYRMWGVADHLEEMLSCMMSCELHDGAMMAAAKTYVDAPDKTAGSLLTTIRGHLDFLSSSHAKRSVDGGWGTLEKIRKGMTLTIYIRVPPHMTESHGKLLRLWLGAILTTVAERDYRPVVPDLFLVDEAATLGYLEELLTAASLLRGYGLRTWTFWQSIGQIEGIYGKRARDILDNAGTVSMFGAANAAAARSLAEITGYEGQILGMARNEQVLCQRGNLPVRAHKLNYLKDPRYRGLFDPNPFYLEARAQQSEVFV